MQETKLYTQDLGEVLGVLFCSFCIFSRQKYQDSGRHQALESRFLLYTVWYCWWKKSGQPVDRRYLYRSSHYLQGFMHPRWLAEFLPSTVVLFPITNCNWTPPGPKKMVVSCSNWKKQGTWPRRPMLFVLNYCFFNDVWRDPILNW